MVLFHVLGPLEVHDHDGALLELGAGKPVTVLANLLLQPNAWITTDRLIETTWQEQAAPASAEANLKTYVWQLRRMLPHFTLPDGEGGPRIESGPGSYRLRIARGELDMHCAADQGREARHALTGGDAATAVALLEQALRLWRGRPFTGPGGAGLDSKTVCEVNAGLDELHRELRESLADAQIALGRPREAVATLRALVADDPLREGVWAQLVCTLHAVGRRAEALAAYRQARRVLSSELGVEPGPALAEAQRRVLGGENPAEQAVPLPEAAPRRELPRDVPDFAGRTRELAALREACAGGTPIVLVDGMPGAGKTALAVHAAHTLADRFPDGRLFVNLRAHDERGPLTVEDALARLLRALGIPPAAIPSDVDERAALWRSAVSTRRVLLVLDDAVDDEQVEQLVPGTSSARVLITTRNRNWLLAGTRRITVGPLDSAAAVAMLEPMAGRGGVVAELAECCGRLPVALREIAARLAAGPHWSAERLVRELGEDGGLLLTGVTEAAFTTSYRLLPPSERSAVRVLGILPGEFDLPQASAALGLGTGAARTVLEALVERNLLTAIAPDTYRSHVLLRRHVRRIAAEPLPLPMPLPLPLPLPLPRPRPGRVA